MTQTQSKKKWPLLAAVIAVLGIAAALIIVFVVTPQQNYQKALDAIGAGDYLTAESLLTELGDYKDAEAKLSEIAEPLRWAKMAAAQPGDTVTYGSYEQDNDTGNGAEPIEWRVLDNQGGKLLLIVNIGLECVPYHTEYTDITWENCYMRQWLNSDFIAKAFTAQEQERIESTVLKNEDHPVHGTEGGNDTTDKVFLLSLSELETYLPEKESRQILPSAYMSAHGSLTSQGAGKYAWWFLRSPGINSSAASNVYGSGVINEPGNDVNYATGAARAVMWLNCN